MLRHFINLLLWLLPPSRLFRLRRVALRIAGIDAGAGSSVCGRGWIYGRGPLKIGEGTWLSPGVLVYTHLDATIDLGASCDIGPGVEFITGSHVIGGAERRAGPGTAGSIKIGSGCWIGAGTRIFGNVTIGEGSVVAAGAVVVGNIPRNSLAAGVPARVKRALPAA